MKTTSSLDLPGALFVCVLMLLGCSRTPPAPKHPLASGSSCAAEALTLYDKDGDGAIDTEELKSSPGLLAAIDRVDEDRDRKLSAAEIAQRVDAFRNSRAVTMTANLAVQRNGAPLEGVQVVIEPESFLKGLPAPTVGVTDARGEISLSGQDAKFPGVYCGLYRVRITKLQQGRETIPARFNTETTLGFELAPDVPFREKILFDLK